MTWFYLVILASLIVHMLHSVKRDESFSMNDVDREINRLRNKINEVLSSPDPDSSDSRIMLAQEWGMLGIFLQIKDARYHVAGGASMKYEALHAFETGIKYIDVNDSRLLRLRVSLHHRMGMLLKMMGLGEEAIEAHKVVFELSEHSYDLALGLFHQAEALIMLGKVREAIPIYEQVLEVKPDRINTYYQLVRAKRELNETPDKEWEILLARMISEYKKYKKLNLDPARDAAAFTYMAQSPDTGIYWAIYETAENLGHYQKAWEYLEKGHVIERAKHYSHNRKRTQDKSETIKEIFSPGFWPTPSIGYDSKIPVFIIGMMRSGSTLTETMLDSHKHIYGMGEETIFGAETPGLQNILIKYQGQTTANKGFVSEVKAHGKIVVDKMMKTSDKGVANTTKEGKVLRVIDKNLFNFGNVGFIHFCLPNAVIIHCVRDPLDTLLSIYKNKLGDQEIEWAHHPEDLVFEYIHYLEVVAHFRKVLPGRMHEILYADTVRNPEKTMKEIVNLLDLEWDPNIMNYHKSNRTIQTLSMTQVRYSVYSKSVGGWRKYAKQMQPFIDEFNKYIPDLRRRGVLPFPNKMNWNFNPHFDYGFGPVTLKAGGKKCSMDFVTNVTDCNFTDEEYIKQTKSKLSTNNNIKTKKKNKKKKKSGTKKNKKKSLKKIKNEKKKKKKSKTKTKTKTKKVKKSSVKSEL